MTTKLLFLSMFFCATSLAQSPNFVWDSYAGGISPYANDGRGICTDLNGNVLVTGFFRDSIITFGSTTLTNSGYLNSSDIFIVKYNPSGNVIWAKSNGGRGDDFGQTITTDNSGNIFSAGLFKSDSITFDSTYYNASNVGNGDMFIAKYDSNGNILWANHAGGYYEDIPWSVAIDNAGNPLVTGRYESSSITFGSDTLTNPVSGFNKANIFIVKYNSNGSVLWANNYGGTNDDRAYGISLDGSGNIFIAGSFKSPSVTFGTTTLTNASSVSYDICVVKFDSSGNVLWAKSAGGAYLDEAYSIRTDGSGNAFVTGSFASVTTTFGSTTLTNANSSGGGDIFIVKYDAAGNEVWAKRAGGINIDVSYCVSSDGLGNAYITGYYFNPTITFGSTTLTSAGLYEIFIAKYDDNGNSVWAKSVGGIQDDVCNSIATTSNGITYMTGKFLSDTITFATTITANDSTAKIFIAKLDNVTGMFELNNFMQSVKLFPNPSQGCFTVEFPNETKSIQLFNSIGELLQTRTVTEQTPQDFSIEAEGIYFMTLKTKSEVETIKIIVCK